MIPIRKMLPRDRSAVYEILQQTDMFTLDEISVAMELIDVYLFNSEQKDYLIYIATGASNRIVGYVCYGPTPATVGTFDLYWIAVSPDMQNRGVGKQLLRFVEAQIAEQEGRMLIIETSSQERYSPTQEFYERNGYTVEARIGDFYRIGDDRLIYVKRFEPLRGGEE
ncbi:GNAT family N-acetyltransferase [candidate division KSB1 bacterium]|nr:GNAT family N-acetyltransferase [candidate division KSB1 bacterium]